MEQICEKWTKTLWSEKEKSCNTLSHDVQLFSFLQIIFKMMQEIDYVSKAILSINMFSREISADQHENKKHI